MKTKILNAIDKGVMNALTTDISDQDIDFNSNDINNEYLYKVTIDELYDIFTANKEGIFQKYDTKNAISLILDDNSEISLYEYKESDKVCFIKLSNKELKRTDNEILIYVPEKHCIPEKHLEFQMHYKQLLPDDYLIKLQDNNYEECFDKAGKDLYGYRNTRMEIISLLNDYQERGPAPAFEYCLKTNICMYNAYLPACGQMKILVDYIDILNYVLMKIHAKPLNLENNRYMTSSESSNVNIWLMGYGNIGNYYKDEEYTVLPLFTTKKLLSK